MRYVIVGNGVAGITAAFTLRARDLRAEITVVSGESDYFFSRTALMYAYLDRMTLRDLEPYEREVYDVQRITRRRAWVRSLDTAQHRLTLDDGSALSYDRLLIASGSSPRRADWPGLADAQQGVVTFVSLQDLAQCEALTPSTRRAVVVGGGLIGVELVECLVHHGVEVEFLVREPSYWPVALKPDEALLVEEEIRAHGVDLRMREEVARVKVDAAGRVAGIQSSTGRATECQMLGVCIGAQPNVAWLGGALDVGRGVRVTSDFRASAPDVWAAGDCAEIGRILEQIWYSAKRQGELAARSMLGDDIDYRPPLFYNSAKFFELEYTTVGEVASAPSGSREYFHRVPGPRASVRVVEHEGAVVGFNMLGSRWNHRVLEQWVRERRSLEAAVADLPRAQFDVEFGRVRVTA
ncbi:MAG: NAD(P)/FAD-dependent oxidoreductase [Acidobacteria bacterium]|nr:NAD(P)/FAD-dependent oxidoreductase [Acidobacteriota bacterium]